jgi:hypothetical protein
MCSGSVLNIAYGCIHHLTSSADVSMNWRRRRPHLPDYIQRCFLTSYSLDPAAIHDGIGVQAAVLSALQH